MSEKLCVFCKHFRFENDVGGEYPDGASLICEKMRFRGEGWSGPIQCYDEGDMRRAFQFAETCPDYQRPK
jgi:hypothetical protein